jgi:general secretion pathway protein G
MKLNLQRNQPRTRRERGFTLVEMIGVLAIIAILASLLIPRVFQAIGDSKINNAVTTCNSIKAGVNEYYGRFGIISGSQGVTPLVFVPAAGAEGVSEDWDRYTLVADGFIEKPFIVRIGEQVAVGSPNGSRLRVVKIGAAVVGDGIWVDDANASKQGRYDLDGDGDNDIVGGSLLVEACMQNVDTKDAKDLNDRLDGTALGAALGSDDLKGRVKYKVNGATATVRIYLAHR